MRYGWWIFWIAFVVLAFLLTRPGPCTYQWDGQAYVCE